MNKFNFRLQYWMMAALILLIAACDDDDTNKQLAAPVLNNATEITTTGFKISWIEVSGADSYLIDISTDEDFDEILDEYNKKEVEETTVIVDGLTEATTYYVRAFSVKGTTMSLASQTLEVITEEEVEEGE